MGGERMGGLGHGDLSNDPRFTVLSAYLLVAAAA